MAVFQWSELREFFSGQNLGSVSVVRVCFSGNSKGSVSVVRECVCFFLSFSVRAKAMLQRPECFSGQSKDVVSMVMQIENVSVVTAKPAFQWSKSVFFCQSKGSVSVFQWSVFQWSECVSVVTAKQCFSGQRGVFFFFFLSEIFF